MEPYQGERQLDALGDASRRAVIGLLAAQGPQSVGSLADQLPISRPAVSQHLRVLKAAGLVRDRAEGTRRIYSLDDSGLHDLRAFFTTFWQHDLNDFAAFVRTTQEENS